MTQPIVALTLNPHTVSLAGRPYSLFVDPATGLIFVDEGPGAGRVNGVVFDPKNDPVFVVRKGADERSRLDLTYLGERYPVGTSAEGDALRVWAEKANAAVRAKGWQAPPGLTATTLPSLFPCQFGKFYLDGELGRGGMGVVYAARDIVLQRRVALKVPLPGRMAEPEVRERFRREVASVVRLDAMRSANICKLFESDVCDGVPYFAMELVDGESLHDYWRTRGPALGCWGAADLVERLARVVHQVHTKTGQIHLDLKPTNVLIVPPDEPGGRAELVVVDFGLARPTTEGGAGTGLGVGTPPYMAPEQYGDGRELTWATDVYALGVILYEMLTGKPPFDGDRAQLREQARRATPEVPSVRARNAELKRFDAVCATALARSRADRFPSAKRFADALGEVYRDYQAKKIDTTRTATRGNLRGPLVDAHTLRLAFVPPGYTAEPEAGADRLLVDVGTRTAAGAVGRDTGTTTTTRTVFTHPEFVTQARKPDRLADDLFTLVLPAAPGLDAVAAAHLAAGQLTTGAFPPGSAALVEYVERDAAGDALTPPDRPFTLQAALRRLAARPAAPGAPPEQRDKDAVFAAVRVLEFVLKESAAGAELAAVNAFDAPGVFTPADRAAVAADVSRYRQALADPATAARQCRAHLPGGAVPALLVRGVGRRGDFVGWARGDAHTAGEAPGFGAVVAFEPAAAGRAPACTISVAKNRGVSLSGLGAALDEREAAERARRFGADDRVTDPTTGEALPARPGYANADPWDDGREMGHAAVSSPRSGTVLSAELVEATFLAFAAATEVEPLAMG